MLTQKVEVTENVGELVEKLNFAEKVEHSLELIYIAYKEIGDSLVVANSLGKDSSAVWHLAKRVSPKIRGFIVTTRFKPPETKQFMVEEVARYPELKVFSNDEEIPDKLYETDPDRCCEILKVKPTRQAVKEMEVNCWITGLRCTEGRTRTNYNEVEELDKGLIKLNPILIWYEREVWQYLALNDVHVNPMKPDTLAVHGGFAGDNETGATAVPISQTVSYAYRTAKELADVFGGKSPGCIYTRIANPTTTALDYGKTE